MQKLVFKESQIYLFGPDIFEFSLVRHQLNFNLLYGSQLNHQLSDKLKLVFVDYNPLPVFIDLVQNFRQQGIRKILAIHEKLFNKLLVA